VLPLDLITLTPLMARTSGSRQVVVALVDGPVLTSHPDLAADIRALSERAPDREGETAARYYQHGTFTAGILCARRGSPAPAICPGCQLLVNPVRMEADATATDAPRAEAADVAAAIVQCIDEGARVINVGVIVERSSAGGEHALEAAIDYATGHDVGVVIPASPRPAGKWNIAHPWVIPVVPYDLQGRPLGYADRAIGLRGVGAPGADITSLGVDIEPVTLGGASIATPFVTGTIALLRSEFPDATLAAIRFALTQEYSTRRMSLVPPILNAWAAYQFLKSAKSRRGRLS
jgi:subtilisin family serine protease